MEHLIFTHGRWHKYEYDEQQIREKVFTHRQVGGQIEPNPGDTFSELMSPIVSARKNLWARDLDAYLYQGATWKIELRRKPMTLLEKAKEAIQAVFGDTSVPQAETIDRLEELSEDIRMCMGAIEQDMDAQSWRDE